MASNLFLADLSASTTVNALASLFSSGSFILWASTQPADGNTATSAANYVLAQMSYSTVAFPTATSNSINAATTGVLTTSAAVSSGIAVWYEAVTAGNKRIIMGTVSTAAADCNLNTNNIAQGASVTITAYSLTLPEH